MRTAPIRVGFEISISSRRDGTIEAVYIRLKDAPVARTEEVKPDLLNCDYDEAGELVGIEILAPVKLSDSQSLLNA